MSKRLMTSLLLPFALAGCSDYVEMDKAGTKINCDELLASTSREVDIYDREQDGGYEFSQCRSEIDASHKERCSNHANNFFEQNAWYGGNDGEKIQNNDDARCVSETLKYISLLSNEYQFQGNALIINGTASTKNTLTIYPVEKRTSAGAEYFRVPVFNGKDTLYLRYITNEEAMMVQQQLVKFISS
ncbi:hypothetical protein OH460_08100 [Vibrio sp. Makdt]|uniref:hypothetical protein n=1 Tax=Vibrio sp. Makdt TaxID=2998828 RepID=UPI0022CD87BE|nr:hypothetical protein [Vibrio sp. Makdt]MDA0152260.1 hypothetical protein [Vibrio sp. Makdt]